MCSICSFLQFWLLADVWIPRLPVLFAVAFYFFSPLDSAVPNGGSGIRVDHQN